MNIKTRLSLNRIVCISFVMLLNMASVSYAVTYIVWDNEAGDGNWNTALNWSNDTVPPNNSNYYARINMTAGPVITTGQIVNVYRIYLDGAGNGTLTMNDGTINTSNHIYVGPAPGDIGTLNMNGGTINMANVGSGTLYIGRDAGSVGTLNLVNGTIYCDGLLMGSNTGTNGRINIAGPGRIIINGDVTVTIAPYFTKNWILAYNGKGTVHYDYGVTNPGKTTIWATITNKATLPNPTNGQIYVPYDGATLGWKPGATAGSHNIYLSTVANDVNTAQRLVGDIDASGFVDYFDLLGFFSYWLSNPAGSAPYAGVNGDSIVDFSDYALLAQNWMTWGNPVFRCSQDVNTFSPGLLSPQTTYYWRVDEVNGPQVTKGDVWNFTTAPQVQGEYSLVGKVMCGYQGWFGCIGDQTPRGWVHWSSNTTSFTPATCTVDMWPDATDMSPAEKFLASAFSDGNDYFVFSSAKHDTVIRHFLWMAQYGIDGVFLQRFGTELIPGSADLDHRNLVLSYCKEGANTYGRKYAVMYDLTDLQAGTVVSTIENDWKSLIDTGKIVKDGSDAGYMYHKSNPVVAVWGIGWSDSHHLYSWDECLTLVNFLKDDPVYGGFTVMVGVRDNWCSSNIGNPTMFAIVTKADIISPWDIAGYNSGGITSYAGSKWGPDKSWCTSYHKDYMPVIWPGYSFKNKSGDSSKFNKYPRYGGRFLWDQVRAVMSSTVGTNMIYVAMFDEVDEGTAIFKVSNNPPKPGGATMFVTYNMDGYSCPPDDYLYLVGQAARALRGELYPIPVTRPYR